METVAWACAWSTSVNLHHLLKGSGCDVLYGWNIEARSLSPRLINQWLDQNLGLYHHSSGQHSAPQAQKLLPSLSPTLGFAGCRWMPSVALGFTHGLCFISVGGLISPSVFPITFFSTSNSVSQRRAIQVSGAPLHILSSSFVLNRPECLGWE